MAISKEKEIEMRGYKPVSELFVPNDGLYELIQQFSNLERINHRFGINQMSVKESLKDAKLFYEHFFKLHKVFYYKEHGFLSKRWFVVEKTNPFNLPIQYLENEDIFYGTAYERIISDTTPLIAFMGILLCKPTNEHTSISYTHEIMHTQIDSLYGCVESYFDAEVMSVFIELVITYYISKGGKLLDLEDNRRLWELLVVLEDLIKYIKENGSVIDIHEEKVESATGDGLTDDNEVKSPKLEILEDARYAVSDLKAYGLFITFYYASEEIKREILHSVQKVLDGELTLNEFLNKYEVNLESAQDTKRLTKYFNR